MINRPLNLQDTFESVTAGDGVTLDALLAMSPDVLSLEDPLAPYFGPGNVALGRPAQLMVSEIFFDWADAEGRPDEGAPVAEWMTWLIGFERRRWRRWTAAGGVRPGPFKQWLLENCVNATSCFSNLSSLATLKAAQLLRLACGGEPMPSLESDWNAYQLVKNKVVPKPQRKNRQALT